MINFSKMHSLGNDFMVVDALSDAVTLKPEQIAKWGDRQRGMVLINFSWSPRQAPQTAISTI